MALPAPHESGVKDRGRLQRLLREKTSEKVYPKTLIITALTAATVALVSSRLNGLVDSLVLVALASILTAFISEFYRLTLETSHRAIAKAVAKSLDNRLSELTGEIPVIDASVEEELVQEALHPQEDSKQQRPVVWLFFHRIFVSRWAVPLVFTLVALATVSTSYVLGQLNSSTSYNVVKEITNTKDISDRKANAIEKSAVAAAQEEASAASSEANALVDSTRQEMLTRIGELQTQLEQAQADDAADAETIELLSKQIVQLQTQLTQFETAMEQLQTRLDELEAQTEQTPTETPTDTPTDTPDQPQTPETP